MLSSNKVPSTHLVKRNRSTAIRVKHGHEQLDRVQFERRPITVDKRLLKLYRIDMTATVAVYRDEPAP